MGFRCCHSFICLYHSEDLRLSSSSHLTFCVHVVVLYAFLPRVPVPVLTSKMNTRPAIHMKICIYTSMHSLKHANSPCLLTYLREQINLSRLQAKCLANLLGSGNRDLQSCSPSFPYNVLFGADCKDLGFLLTTDGSCFYS